MSQDHSHDNANHGPLTNAELERLARCAADGELSAEDAARYESAKRANPSLAGFEESERKLRGAIGRCMAADCQCPDALRSKISSMVAGTAPAPQLGLAGTPADTPEQSAGTPSAMRFPMWQRVAAFAAAVVIIVGVSSYLQQNPSTQQGAPGVALAEMPTGIQLAGFMSDEHNRCAMHPTTMRKFTQKDLSGVPSAFRDVLGERVQPEDLLPTGATFVAAGKCKVPGKGPSIHMMYEAFDQAGERVEVSLYIQRCSDERFVSGKAYAIGTEGETTSKIIGWRHNELLYYLVTTSPDTTREMAGKLEAPAIAGAI
ncbi:MAG: hypothetical protein HRU13_07630 [Phycisphaerales bacterium]|nr:hypothetical protein [Phycisphaerales bacterium]